MKRCPIYNEICLKTTKKPTIVVDSLVLLLAVPTGIDVDSK